MVLTSLVWLVYLTSFNGPDLSRVTGVLNILQGPDLSRVTGVLNMFNGPDQSLVWLVYLKDPSMVLTSLVWLVYLKSFSGPDLSRVTGVLNILKWSWPLSCDWCT